MFSIFLYFSLLLSFLIFAHLDWISLQYFIFFLYESCYTYYFYYFVVAFGILILIFSLKCLIINNIFTFLLDNPKTWELFHSKPPSVPFCLPIVHPCLSFLFQASALSTSVPLTTKTRCYPCPLALFNIYIISHYFTHLILSSGSLDPISRTLHLDREMQADADSIVVCLAHFSIISGLYLF